MGELSLFSSENCADLEARNAAGGDDASPRRAGSEKVRQGTPKASSFAEQRPENTSGRKKWRGTAVSDHSRHCGTAGSQGTGEN